MLSLAMAASLLSGCVSSRGESDSADSSSDGTQQTSGGVVNVYNWGEYIDMSVLEDFEAATGIHVNYQMYDSNETMYGKIAGGGADYDVVIPSDYMIARMIEEDMLEPLNFDNIPNFADIDPELKNPEYDPENLYSVPYMWGLMGVIYNKTMVDEADLGSWDLMWNEKYADDIVMIDNSRDAIGIASSGLATPTTPRTPPRSRRPSTHWCSRSPFSRAMPWMRSSARWRAPTPPSAPITTAIT